MFDHRCFFNSTQVISITGFALNDQLLCKIDHDIHKWAARFPLNSNKGPKYFIDLACTERDPVLLTRSFSCRTSIKIADVTLFAQSFAETPAAAFDRSLHRLSPRFPESDIFEQELSA